MDSNGSTPSGATAGGDDDLSKGRGRPKAGQGKGGKQPAPPNPPKQDDAPGPSKQGSAVPPPKIGDAPGKANGIDLVDVGDFDTSKLLHRILVFGRPGSGKTHLMAASGRKTLFLLVETQGFNTVKRAGGKLVSVPTSKGLENGTPRIANLADLKAVLENAKNGVYRAMGYEVIAIDGMTEIQVMMIEAILAAKKRALPAADAKGDAPDTRAKMKAAEGLLTQADWGTLDVRWMGFMRTVRDLPHDVVASALADPTINQETETVELGPLLKGGARKSLNGYFNMVAYLYRKGSDGEGGLERYALVDGDERYSVKPDGGMAGVVTPDLGAWFEVLGGRATADSVRIENAPMPYKKAGSRTTTTLEVDVED